jgi:hypothetical protein
MTETNQNMLLDSTGNAGTDEEMLLELQRQSFMYFIQNFKEENGLIADKTQEGSPSSIAVIGIGISCYIVGVERGYISREEAVRRTLAILGFFAGAPQSSAKDAAGYKGFYYHFLDMQSGKRTWDSELSTIDTALLMAGVMHAYSYYNGSSEAEQRIRQMADDLYGQTDWEWALGGTEVLNHGWKPESGFEQYYWGTGYNEAMILYMLAMGSPTYPISDAGYKKWVSTFEWKELYGTAHTFAGPLFIHQLSHVWIDFKGINDDHNRKTGIDYFENSRRATYVQREYAIDNPNKFDRYGKYCWGLSACDGPGPVTLDVHGRMIEFFNYSSRGVGGPDDGTISPWAIVTSVAFAPEIVIDTVRVIVERLKLLKRLDKGLHAGFNATYPEKAENAHGWVSPWQFGLNQGPVVLMIENYMTGMVWEHMRGNPYLVAGLKKAGFTGGWLDKTEQK